MLGGNISQNGNEAYTNMGKMFEGCLVKQSYKI